MKRGEIWVANLNPSRGAEPGKIRPVLVILADEFIQAGIETIIVLPLTSRLNPAWEPRRPMLAAREGLRQRSQVLVDQPRALDRSKFGEGPLAMLGPKEMAAVERSLSVTLGLPYG